MSEQVEVEGVAGKEKSEVVTVPVSFTRADAESADWPKIRAALLENLAAVVDDLIDGWKVSL